MTETSTYTTGVAVYLRETKTGRIHRTEHFDMAAGDVHPIHGTIEAVADISDVEEAALCRFCWTASERKAMPR